MDRDHNQQPPHFWGSRYSIGLIVIGTAAGYFLLTEHLTHVISALPWLVLLVCPLMHIYMHHGHVGHGHHHDEPKSKNDPDQRNPS